MLNIYNKTNQYYVQGIDFNKQDFWLKESFYKKQFYVYLKMRPDNRIFWVGKGLGYRAFSMQSRTKFYKNIINKYGQENIKTTIIPAASEQFSLAEEIRLIAYFKTLGCKLANVTPGGEGTSGYKHTAETLLKMSISRQGQTMSPEARAKISKGNTGKVRSPEANAKNAKSHLGKIPWNKGKKTGPLSEEHCKNLAISGKGKYFSTERRTNISKSLKGKTFSLERCLNISNGKKAAFKLKKRKTITC